MLDKKWEQYALPLWIKYSVQSFWMWYTTKCDVLKNNQDMD